MALDGFDLRARLARLEHRVQVLELQLSARDQAGALGTEQPPAPKEMNPSTEEIYPSTVAIPLEAADEPPASPPFLPITRKEPPTPRPEFDWEKLIGMRLFAALGAVIVVIGVGLFLKLAYDRGWMNLIPPATKCISGAVFGVLLLGAGEFLRRKWGAIASVGVSAAGLGVLFASVFAAHGVYHLMHPAAAFVLLAAVASVGFVVAARGRLASIAVLALVAAYINPIIIDEPNPGAWTRPVYLFVILCTGLSLSAWRAKPFRVLRGLVWWGTLLFGTAWVLGPGLAHPTPALALLGAVWIAVHAELAVSAKWPASAPVRLPVEVPWRLVRFVGTSFTTTGWAAYLAITVLRQATAIPDWWAPALGAAGAVGLAVYLAGNLRVLRDVPRNDSERLGAGLAMQAGALIIAAVSLALSGWMETVAWLGLGVAAVAAGRWIRSRGLEVYGLVLLAISVVRLLVVDSPFAEPQAWTVGLRGIYLTPWSILMTSAAVAWGLVFLLLRPGVVQLSSADARPGQRTEWSWAAVKTAALIVALCHLNGAVLHPDVDAGSACLVWLVLGLVGFILGRALRAPALFGYAIVVLGLATLRFAVSAPFVSSAAPVLTQFAGLVVSRWMILMIAAAVAWLFSAALIRAESEGSRSIQQWRTRTALVGIGYTLLGVSVLHPRAEAESIAMVWLALGACAVALHSLWGRVSLDVYGLAGAAAAVIAWGLGYCPEWMESRAGVLAHPGLWSSAVIAVLALGMRWWLGSGRNPSRPTVPGTLGLIVPGIVTLLLVSTSFEVARAAGVLASDPTVRRAAVSIWWGLVSVGLIVAGFAARRPLARHSGLALLVLATGKACVFDLAEVPQTWRIASFVGLGLLMLGVAVGYARAAALLRGGPASTANPSM